MDYEILAMLVFSLFVFLIIGGTILLFPLSRKLGRLIEWWIEEKKGVSISPEEVRQLAERVSGLEAKLQSLAERQEFLDSLVVEQRSRAGLPTGDRSG